jgi:nitrogen fixation-related uncharacterized protein
MITEPSLTLVHLIVWGSLGGFVTVALIAISWAARHHQFERLDQAAASIFDPDELADDAQEHRS